MTLNPEDLVVTSFETSPDALSGPGTGTEPTPNTGCFDCPIVFSEPCA